jgi:hypothetical protein
MQYILVYKVLDKILYPLYKDDGGDVWMFLGDESLLQIKELMRSGFGKYYKGHHYSMMTAEYMTFRPIILELPTDSAGLPHFMSDYTVGNVIAMEGAWTGAVGTIVDSSILEYEVERPSITEFQEAIAN